LTPRDAVTPNQKWRKRNFTAKAKKYGRLIIYFIYFASKFFKKLKALDTIKEQEINNYKTLAKEIENSLKIRNL
jgi:hypothetical protein